MSGGTSEGFAAFLRSSAEKLSSKKGVKFVPGHTNSKDEKTSEAKTKNQKEHRRAQVRKAQIEHRQRKENYIKHLEQDVIRLREMISTVEKETLAMKQENMSLKTAVSESNILGKSLPHLPSAQLSNSLPGNPNFQPPQGSPGPCLDFQSPHYSTPTSNPSSTNVSITYDEFIDTSCLQIGPTSSFEQAAILDSPDIFSFPSNMLSQFFPTAVSSNLDLQKELPQLPDHALPPTDASPQLDTASLAINFILALEHPCRTHFHANPTVFDPTGDPTGHELMASTHLYAHAPASVFPVSTAAQPGTTSWTAPTLTLATLYEMSQSLPKGDFEITPVQAWFMLSARYEVGRVVGRIEGLKRRIGDLVSCFAFGAVMDEGRFWDAVGDVLGGQEALE